MSDDSKLENMPPLGRSIEEVESDNQNQVNPSTPGEADRGKDEVSFVPVVNSNLSANVPNVGGPVAASLGATDGAQANSPTVTDDRDSSQS